MDGGTIWVGSLGELEALEVGATSRTRWSSTPTNARSGKNPLAVDSPPRSSEVTVGRGCYKQERALTQAKCWYLARGLISKVGVGATVAAALAVHNELAEPGDIHNIGAAPLLGEVSIIN